MKKCKCEPIFPQRKSRAVPCAGRKDIWRTADSLPPSPSDLNDCSFIMLLLLELSTVLSNVSLFCTLLLKCETKFHARIKQQIK
jgi:hypothetical protein